jgi:hypothetical protein
MQAFKIKCGREFGDGRFGKVDNKNVSAYPNNGGVGATHWWGGRRDNGDSLALVRLFLEHDIYNIII